MLRCRLQGKSLPVAGNIFPVPGAAEGLPGDLQEDTCGAERVQRTSGRLFPNRLEFRQTTWTSITTEQAPRDSIFCRLADHAGLLRLCPRHWRCAEALHADQQRLFPGRPVDPGMGLRPGVHLGEPRSAGGYRDGRVGGEVRHYHQPLLLDRRDPGDDLCRSLHDAVLLWLEGAFRS